METHLAILTLALLSDRLVGDPNWLWEKLPHPVVAFGAAISFVERVGNNATQSASIRRRNGLISIVCLLLYSMFLSAVLTRIFTALGVVGLLFEFVVVAILLAQKSLADHVTLVATGLRERGLSGGREAVSLIVGRDPQSLDESGVCRSAIESLAENFSDGVVAPAFWYALFGLPGIFTYKMLNTADSMIGHKNERYLAFGRAAARLDDLANWPAARVAALLIAAAALLVRGRRAAMRALRAAFQDAGLHRSPNAGWPECAMAGSVGLALAGERTYDGVVVREPLLNATGTMEAKPADIDAAIQVFHTSCSVMTGVAAVLFLLL
ncbi:MAG: cobalamin biosynthesis protein [Hyphomicrobiales bacterium]|nr:cobalamin biosynthesis protein [Hyphomicrobiales bacterium]